MEHKEKIRLAGIRKHGSEAAWREFQRQASNKSARNTGKGGFASIDKEKLREISRKAAHARWQTTKSQGTAPGPNSAEDESPADGKTTDSNQA